MLESVKSLGLVLLAALAGCAGPAPSARPLTTSTRELALTFTPPPMPAPDEFRAATGAPGPAYWQQRADYTIQANLDTDKRAITARQTLTYTNNSPDTLTHLWFNLEQNLFRPNSRGARQTAPGARFGNRDRFDGGFSIRHVAIDGDPVELRVEDTLARLDLPRPLAPRGGTVTIDLSFSFSIPPYGSDRLGIDQTRHGEIFQIAQWFPNVCVYDDVHGWNTLPYLGQGEFYTNFGRYDVSITVPRSHLVAATGVLQNPEEVLTPVQRERLSAARATTDSIVIRSRDEVADPATRPPGDGPLTWRFIAEDVRTFAWASSGAFAWDACTHPGSGPAGAGTLCQSFYPAEAARVWGPDALGGGSSQMLRASLAHYGEKWYPYPYPVATNVNGIVGGMEYPMIVFCGGGRQQPNANEEIPSARDAERGLFGVTTHEIGHNWFPMLLSSDERRHAWMDEGFDTFINYYASLERYPDILPRRGNARVWARDHPRPSAQVIDIPADEVAPGTLGDMQYGKTAAGLVLLREGILGEERFDRAFREYIRRWAFKHPRPWDFFRTIEDVAGEDLGWFWRGWFYSTGITDQAIERVDRTEHGSTAIFINRGEVVMPLAFTVEYDDGERQAHRLPVTIWRDSDRYAFEMATAGRAVRSIEIDPDEDFPDVDLSNNAWPRRARTRSGPRE